AACPPPRRAARATPRVRSCGRGRRRRAASGAVPAGQEQPSAERQDERRETDDREVGRPPAVPARGRAPREGARVDRPRDDREEGERVEGEDAPPGGARPQDAQEDADRQEREPERERAVRQPVQRLEGGQAVVEGARSLQAKLVLLQE